MMSRDRSPQQDHGRPESLQPANVNWQPGAGGDRERDAGTLDDLRDDPVAGLFQPTLYRPAQIAVASFLLVLAMGAAGLAYVETDAVAHARGVVRPAGDVVRVQASIPGKIAVVSFKEGDAVEAGAVVMAYDTAGLEVRLSGLRAETGRVEEVLLQLQEKRAQLIMHGQRQAEIAALGVEAARIEASESALQAERDLDDARDRRARAAHEAEFLRTKAESIRKLFEGNLVARMELDEVNLRLKTAELELQAASRRESPGSGRAALARVKLERETAAADAERSDLLSQLADLQTEIAASERARDQLVREIAAEELTRREACVRSPIGGVITTLAVQHGGTVVATGEPLFVVAPDGGGLVVELEVPGSEIGSVQAGQEVQFVFDSFPYVEYGYGTGAISRISPDSSGERGAVVYRAWATLAERSLAGPEGRRGEVRVGMAAEARIVTGRSSLALALLSALAPGARTVKPPG